MEEEVNLDLFSDPNSLGVCYGVCYGYDAKAGGKLTLVE